MHWVHLTVLSTFGHEEVWKWLQVSLEEDDQTIGEHWGLEQL